MPEISVHTSLAALYNICSNDIWQISTRYQRVVKQMTSSRYLVDLCSTSVAPLEPPLQRCSRGRTEVHPISCRYQVDLCRRCSKVPFLCASVLRSLRTGVLPSHWVFEVSMTHGRCNIGCRSPSHELGTPRRRQEQFCAQTSETLPASKVTSPRPYFGAPGRA